jgi:hypothetical protein
MSREFSHRPLLVVVLGLYVYACSPTETPQFDCEVAIVGGGVGGLHTAFRLAPMLGDSVCLFEKEAVLGGRIRDASYLDDPAQPRVGVGARRVMEGQDVLFSLADELGIVLQTPLLTAELIGARGAFSFSKEELLSRYPDVTPSPDGDTEAAMYDALRFGPERENIDEYPNITSYVKSVVGEAGFEYLNDMTRFRSDLTYPIDARGYMDWLDEEWDNCCTASYPVGGMSSFVFVMQEAAESNGARILISDPVAALRRTEEGYEVTSRSGTRTAKKLVIAVPPNGLEWIEGDVVEDIRVQEAYQAILPVRVTTITQWWPEAWWSDIVNPDAEENGNVWRAWTTEGCITSIEIPQESYLASAFVTRSVFTDDLECVLFWAEIGQQGIDAVEAELDAQLTALFNNGVSKPDTVVIPEPLETRVTVWPEGWYWLGAGTRLTNAEIYEWALNPLEGKDVALVGDAYNPQRSGWSDAAFKSSIHLLNERYGMALPGLGSPNRESTALWEPFSDEKNEASTGSDSSGPRVGRVCMTP